jgi:hypothetical protein
MIGGADTPGVRAPWSLGLVTGQRSSAGVAAARPGVGVRAGGRGCLAGRGARADSPGGGVVSVEVPARSAVCSFRASPVYSLFLGLEGDYVFAIKVV